MWADILFKFQWKIKKALLKLNFGPGLCWAYPLNNKRKLKNHAVNYVLMAATRKADTCELLVLLQLVSFIIKFYYQEIVINEQCYGKGGVMWKDITMRMN